MGSRTSLKTWVVMAFFMVWMGCTAAVGRSIYVDVNVPGPLHDGNSWSTAYKYLQDAWAAASSGDEIRVAKGIYKPDQGAGVPAGERIMAFFLKNGVAIRGGYAGFGEPDPNARIGVYQTILSGDLNGDDSEVIHPDEPTRAENSINVVRTLGNDATAVLDGFTITGGNYNIHGIIASGGGGMLNFSSSPTVMNCIFHSNSAGDGGGMFNDDSSPTLINCTFSNNSASGGCGGMYNAYYSSPTIANCIFWGNSDSYGMDESAQIGVGGGQIVVNYCCIQGWTGSLGGKGNIGEDPLFADPNNRDYHLLSERGRYSPMLDLWVIDEVTSPCIDGGDPMVDPTEERQPNGGMLNMGAYGGTAYASLSEWEMKGDINRDSVVNMIDFSIFAEYWLQTSLRAREIDNRLRCAANLRGLGKAMLIYSNDYGEYYPTADIWCDLLMQYAGLSEDQFVCPSGGEGRSHYAINPSAAAFSHPEMVLLFETGPGWNQFGGPELLAPENHQGEGCNILFNDGHVEFVETKRFDELRWE